MRAAVMRDRALVVADVLVPKPEAGEVRPWRSWGPLAGVSKKIHWATCPRQSVSTDVIEGDHGATIVSP